MAGLSAGEKNGPGTGRRSGIAVTGAGGKDKIVRLILGDQLNIGHSWFRQVDARVLYVMMEVRSETDYVIHHVQKVLAFFSAMRRFAGEMRSAGHRVHYLTLDHPSNRQTITGNLADIITSEKASRFEYQLPDEYRLDEVLKKFCAQLSIRYSVADTEHFLSTRGELEEVFEGRKQFLMETFYRHMRRKYNILMQGGQPWQGQWNLDSENRHKLPANHQPPEPLLFDHDLDELQKMLQACGVKSMGQVDARHFCWPVTRDESLELLEHFVTHELQYFGTYQDAMTDKGWSLYHSRLSFALNVKLISPAEVIHRAIAAFEHSKESISYNQLEGFVRQILGWREYMRGVYWSRMPEFGTLNFFEHGASLPEWYWTGRTKMACLRHAITQSLEYAYAHHIQRLMVTGNFALLAGVHPDEVDQWYLGIYIDAIEWVEITNTRGMSQYADGGSLATKPYVSSASYIHKMSNYCAGCFYKHAIKTGERACPFNSLYWNFLDRHRAKLAGNPRMGMMYHVWDKMTAAERAAMLQQAGQYLQDIGNL